MKALSLLLMVTLLLWGDATWSDEYEKAFQSAQQQNKGVMLMLTKKDCNACIYMDNEVLSDPKIFHKLSQNFILLHLDIYKDDLHALEYMGTPTFYFMHANGDIVERISGSRSIKKFDRLIDKVNVMMLEEDDD